METKSISRRDLLKSTGVLIVGFSFFGAAARTLAQGDGLSVDGMDPTVLDSWMAISKDGTVTVFTGKVELGTGVVTALSQIVAEELDVAFNKVYMESGDTDTAVDQGVTAAARTVERGGVQLRQASAAARQELLKLAAVRLDSPVDKLTVTDGVVSVVGNPNKKIAYGDLLGGKKFNIKIVAAGVGWDMKVAPDVPAKNPKDYKIRASTCRENSRASLCIRRMPKCRECCTGGWCVRPPRFRPRPALTKAPSRIFRAS
jgi:nicotinate dehydrogenase subunit B